MTKNKVTQINTDRKHDCPHCLCKMTESEKRMKKHLQNLLRQAYKTHFSEAIKKGLQKRKVKVSPNQKGS